MSPIPLSRRAILARQHAGLSRAELAEKVVAIYGGDFTEAQVEAIESGSAKYSRRLVDIAVVCGVEIEWLGLGEGTMTPGSPPSEVAQPTDTITRDEARLIDAYRHLPPDLQAAQLLTAERLALPFREGYKSWSKALDDLNGKRA